MRYCSTAPIWLAPYIGTRPCAIGAASEPCRQKPQASIDQRPARRPFAAAAPGGAKNGGASSPVSVMNTAGVRLAPTGERSAARHSWW